MYNLDLIAIKTGLGLSVAGIAEHECLVLWLCLNISVFAADLFESQGSAAFAANALRKPAQ
jgi:hypothetical protein